jgi:hypothetical protein
MVSGFFTCINHNTFPGIHLLSVTGISPERQDTLVKMGYLKLVQREDERQAAMAGLMTKQLTQPGEGFFTFSRRFSHGKYGSIMVNSIGFLLKLAYML